MARNTKQTVLDAGIMMFAERGYLGTSMRDLADTIGVTQRALYRHYDSKTDLYLAAAAPLLDAVDQLLNDPPDRTDRKALLLWVTAYTGALRTDLKITRIVGAEIAWAHSPAVGPRARSQDTQLRRILAGDGPTAEARGAAALGMLWWPILCLHEQPSETAARSAQRALRVGSRT